MALLRESEYLLKTAFIYNTILRNEGNMKSFSPLSQREILTSYNTAVLNREHAVIPDHIRLISTEAFAKKNRIQTIEFPAGLVQIHARAFRQCQALQEICLPHSVEILGKEAFAG